MLLFNLISMEQSKKKEETNFGLSPYLLFGTFSLGFLGSAIRGYVCSHIKHSESESAEA